MTDEKRTIHESMTPERIEAHAEDKKGGCCWGCGADVPDVPRDAIGETCPSCGETETVMGWNTCAMFLLHSFLVQLEMEIEAIR